MINFDKNEIMQAIDCGYSITCHYKSETEFIDILIFQQTTYSEIHFLFSQDDKWEGEQIELHFSNFKQLIDFLTANFEVTNDK